MGFDVIQAEIGTRVLLVGSLDEQELKERRAYGKESNGDCRVMEAANWLLSDREKFLHKFKGDNPRASHSEAELNWKFQMMGLAEKERTRRNEAMMNKVQRQREKVTACQQMVAFAVKKRDIADEALPALEYTSEDLNEAEVVLRNARLDLAEAKHDLDVLNRKFKLF